MAFFKKDYGTISIGQIQHKCKIGFNYANNIMNALCANGYVGEENGVRPRTLLCPESKVWKYIEKNISQLRPIEYNSFYGATHNGSPYDISPCNYDEMEGHDFEYFCADLLRKNGFINVEVTQGSGDHGIDILAEKDDITYAIQCKCYSSNISNAAVQQAHTGKSLYHRDVAVVMTNQYFTQQAKEEAVTLSVKLWDRDKLNSLIESAPQ